MRSNAKLIANIISELNDYFNRKRTLEKFVAEAKNQDDYNYCSELLYGLNSSLENYVSNEIPRLLK